MLTPYYQSVDDRYILYYGDLFEILPKFNYKFDMIFSDPPYFLSNNGLSINNGKIVNVNKGNWDKSSGYENDNKFNLHWILLLKKLLKENGTIWISGTKHNIYSIGHNLLQSGFKILNMVTWEKVKPPPNFSHKYFSFSTEFIIWAKIDNNIKHYFDYDLMKIISNGKQMKDVWKLSAVEKWEKLCGKHPTQKPLSLLSRIILSSTKENSWILDPFAGSCTTGIAAGLCNRKFIGIDSNKNFLNIGINRKLEIEKEENRVKFISHIRDLTLYNNFENKRT